MNAGTMQLLDEIDRNLMNELRDIYYESQNYIQAKAVFFFINIIFDIVSCRNDRNAGGAAFADCTC